MFSNSISIFVIGVVSRAGCLQVMPCNKIINNNWRLLVIRGESSKYITNVSNYIATIK